MSWHRWVRIKRSEKKGFRGGSQGDRPALYLAINLPDGVSPASDEGHPATSCWGSPLGGCVASNLVPVMLDSYVTNGGHGEIGT